MTQNWMSIIIPAWCVNQDTVNCTIACLESVSIAAREYPTELVLVDNGSGGPEKKIVREKLDILSSTFASVKYLQLKENLGFVKATNLGIDSADGNQIMFLNNDTVLPSKAISRLARSQKETRAWAVGPVCRIKTNPMRGSWQSIDRCRQIGIGLNKLEPYRDIDLEGYNEKLWTSGLVRGFSPSMLAFFCTVFPSTTFDRVGYLDEIYGCGLGDDDDYCKRIRAAGGKMYLEPRVLIEHNHRTSFKTRHKLLGINYHEESAKNLKIFKSRWSGH